MIKNALRVSCLAGSGAIGVAFQHPVGTIAAGLACLGLFFLYIGALHLFIVNIHSDGKL